MDLLPKSQELDSTDVGTDLGWPFGIFFFLGLTEAGRVKCVEGSD